MSRETDIETRALERKPRDGVEVRVGRRRWVVPTATIIAGVLAAAGLAREVVNAKIADFRAERAAEASRLAAVEERVADCSRKLELEQAILAEIRTQLARIDARVAEVQVVLMRQR